MTSTGARDSACVAIVGSGGAGALTAGSILLEAAGKAGWYGLMTRSVGPQIRGGEAAAFVRLSTHPVECIADRCDAVIAIDWRKADRFADEFALDSGSLLVGDPRGGDVPEALLRSGAATAEVPMKELAKGIEGGRPNMIALGVAAGLVGLSTELVMAVLEKRIGSKGAGAVAASRAAVEIGLDHAQRIGRPIALAAAEGAGHGRWQITGNEAAGLGAVRGGVRFAAAYPITPATELLEWLTPALAKVGGVLVQAEDELASVNMIIGSSFGGTPSLTATSGPGLALMIEALGLATASEIPIVVVDVMRAGPSTGIPTKSEQSDLNIAVHGCHGDAPHIVVAPLSVSDCVFTTQWAVHLAEAMQAPAIVLSDQFLGQTLAVIDPPAPVAFLAQRRVPDAAALAGYQRYKLAADGVSPMALPGMAAGQYTADGLTHNEKGTPSSRTSDHRDQLDKRRDKLTGFAYGDHWAQIEGDGDLVLLTWGSLTGAAREAAQRLSEAGVATRLVAPRLIAPLQVDRLQEAIAGRRVLVIEQNHSGQLYRYLRSMCDLPGEVRTLYRPGPQPIRPGEICAAAQAWRSQ
ncbi:MAG: 2-oxoacid:acceptor oxidoreductase subunit alpha [Hyphomicrobiaceae bacterium]|nr:2-oxoacid:acceptor oxidoreductase subunit alpha [Hyphomicrobiaceae bacterium]